MQTQIIELDSIEALIKTAREPSTWGERESETGTVAFCNTLSMEQACDFALQGWPEGLQKMSIILDGLQASTTAVGRAPAYMLDVAGAYPHAAIAATGDAFCMIAPTPVSERARPIIRIATSTALSSAFETSEVFNYGAGLVSVIDALENAGFSVELQSIRCNVSTRDDKQRLVIKTVLKQAGEILDRERLAFCLGNASFNRRIHFAVVEAKCSAEYWQGTYGRAAQPERGSELDDDVCLLPGPLMFGFNSKALASPEAAQKAMLPAILELLRDRYANFPPLLFEDSAQAA
jgi:hypothetical protein